MDDVIETALVVIVPAVMHIRNVYLKQPIGNRGLPFSQGTSRLSSLQGHDPPRSSTFFG